MGEAFFPEQWSFWVPLAFVSLPTYVSFGGQLLGATGEKRNSLFTWGDRQVTRRQHDSMNLKRMAEGKGTKGKGPSALPEGVHGGLTEEVASDLGPEGREEFIRQKFWHRQETRCAELAIVFGKGLTGGCNGFIPPPISMKFITCVLG